MAFFSALRCSIDRGRVEQSMLAPTCRDDMLLRSLLLALPRCPWQRPWGTPSAGEDAMVAICQYPTMSIGDVKALISVDRVYDYE